MRLYRVEHKDTHKGPWCGTFVKLDANSMPCPWADTWTDTRECGPSWYYAFPPWAHFKRWFSLDDCRALNSQGFVLACYVAPRDAVRLAAQQAQVDVTRAFRLCAYPLLDAHTIMQDVLDFGS